MTSPTMTRRTLLALFPGIAAAGGVPVSPRNSLCTAANEFHAPYATWAETMNVASKSPHVIPADAIEAFEPLPNLWRRVEHAYRAWVRGF